MELKFNGKFLEILMGKISKNSLELYYASFSQMKDHLLDCDTNGLRGRKFIKKNTNQDHAMWINPLGIGTIIVE